MHRSAVRERWWIVLLLTVGVLVAAATVWPGRGNSPVAADHSPSSRAGSKTVQMRIAGMTCAACAHGLEASFHKMAGVEKAAIDYESGRAMIMFDPAKQSAESLSKLVAECGYRAKEIKLALK